MPLTVAGLQAPGLPGDVDANLSAIREAARAAVAAGAGLLITPEMFVTGYNLPREQLLGLTTPRLADAVADIAREHGIAIAAGLPEPADGGIANSCLLVDAAGRELTRYRKTHLFGDLDRSLFVPGDGYAQPVDVQGVRVVPLICYDAEFPESVRAVAAAGAELVVVPTAQMEPFHFIADHVLRVRAWENQVYLAYVNRVGAEGDLRYIGRSSIVAPSGEVLAAPADPLGESLIIAEIDREVVLEAQRRNPYLADRRPELD